MYARDHEWENFHSNLAHAQGLYCLHFLQSRMADGDTNFQQGGYMHGYKYVKLYDYYGNNGDTGWYRCIAYSDSANGYFNIDTYYHLTETCEIYGKSTVNLFSQVVNQLLEKTYIGV